MTFSIAAESETFGREVRVTTSADHAVTIWVNGQMVAQYTPAEHASTGASEAWVARLSDGAAVPFLGQSREAWESLTYLVHVWDHNVAQHPAGRPA